MRKLNCYICGKIFERKPCKIKRSEKHYCSNDCRYKGQELPKHKSWIEYGVVYLEITKGHIVLLDEIDRDLMDQNWQFRKNHAAKKDKAGTHIYMHRLIAERKYRKSLGNNENVDHINGNGFDNRRKNVRLTTSLENGANTMHLRFIEKADVHIEQKPKLGDASKP